MLVKMNVTISGTRNGQAWPQRGETVELPDAEATELVAAGLAEEAKNAAPASTESQVAASGGDEGDTASAPAAKRKPPRKSRQG